MTVSVEQGRSMKDQLEVVMMTFGCRCADMEVRLHLVPLWMTMNADSTKSGHRAITGCGAELSGSGFRVNL